MGREPAGIRAGSTSHPIWEIAMPNARACIVIKPWSAARRRALHFGTAWCAAVILALALGAVRSSHAQTLTPQQQLALDIYRELVEINTVTETGDTGRAADAMAARLRAAGFGGSDLQVFKPAPRKGNVVARLRGTGARKPILLLAHMDAVPANPEDWSRRMAISTDAAPTTTRPWPRIWWRTSSATRRKATNLTATSL